MLTRFVRSVALWMIRCTGMKGPIYQWRKHANGADYYGITMYQDCPCPQCSPYGK